MDSVKLQFAYNEMSFFLIRLLQNFSHVELDLSAQPPDARPPADWASAEGQKGREQIIPKCHLTLYVLVSALGCCSVTRSNDVCRAGCGSR